MAQHHSHQCKTWRTARLHAHTQVTPLREPCATPREVRLQKASSRQPAQQQQQHQQTSSIGRRPVGPKDPCNCGMGPRSSASKLSQIRDPSPLWKLPSPNHKYRRVTIRHTMGTTQKHIIYEYNLCSGIPVECSSARAHCSESTLHKLSRLNAST